MRHIASALLCVVALSIFFAFKEKPTATSEKIENKVKDSLDRRSAEKARDTLEDTRDTLQK